MFTSLCRDTQQLSEPGLSFIYKINIEQECKTVSGSEVKQVKVVAIFKQHCKQKIVNFN